MEKKQRDLSDPFLKEYEIVASVDEVGRGALAGPVCVGLVVVKQATYKPCPKGLDDSKKLTQKKREALITPIKEWATDYSIGEASAREIDTYGIMAALRLAAERAFTDLQQKPEFILIDGSFNWLRRPDPTGLANTIPDEIATSTLIKADTKIASCAAASVLAKVFRDQIMMSLDKIYKPYRHYAHKGYGTKEHRDAILKHGLTNEHRKTWNFKK